MSLPKDGFPGQDGGRQAGSSSPPLKWQLSLSPGPSPFGSLLGVTLNVGDAISPKTIPLSLPFQTSWVATPSRYLGPTSESQGDVYWARASL